MSRAHTCANLTFHQSNISPLRGALFKQSLLNASISRSTSDREMPNCFLRTKTCPLTCLFFFKLPLSERFVYSDGNSKGWIAFPHHWVFPKCLFNSTAFNIQQSSLVGCSVVVITHGWRIIWLRPKIDPTFSIIGNTGVVNCSRLVKCAWFSCLDFYDPVR